MMTRIPGPCGRGHMWWSSAAVSAVVILGASLTSLAAINLDTSGVEKTVVFIHPAKPDGQMVQAMAPGQGVSIR